MLLELRNIHYAWPGRPPMLCGASLDLAACERLCLSGPNGVGKSTLLRIILGLCIPTSGQVIGFGRICAREEDFVKLRRRVGLVFQDPDDQLFCPSVMEDMAFGPLNLGWSRERAFAEVERLLGALDLLHLKNRVTHKLSGGEKRLISLASVLVMQPEILLLDEPTNALDEENRDRLMEILQSLPQSMIFVSHDAHFRAKLETRRVQLRDGLISAPEPVCRHAV